MSARSAAAVTGLVLLIVLLVAAGFAILGLSIWALVFGIVDITQHGANGWAIFWIVLGGVGILSSLASGRKAAS